MWRRARNNGYRVYFANTPSLHISDPHLPPLPVPRFSELLSKRMFGFINWQKKRRDIHLFDTHWLRSAEVKKQAPDHIALTGDLVNLALLDEYPAARNWLEQLGSPKDITLVAGNHDAYLKKMEKARAKRFWGPYGGAATIRPSRRFRSCVGAGRSPSSG